MLAERDEPGDPGQSRVLLARARTAGRTEGQGLEARNAVAALEDQG